MPRLKPATLLVFDYLLQHRSRPVPSAELVRNLSGWDFRSRLSEIRKELERTNSPIRLVSTRIPGMRSKQHQLVVGGRL